jgi:hypothetical protein
MKNNFGGEKVFTQYKEIFDDKSLHHIIESSDDDPFDDTIEKKVVSRNFKFNSIVKWIIITRFNYLMKNFISKTFFIWETIEIIVEIVEHLKLGLFLKRI